MDDDKKPHVVITNSSVHRMAMISQDDDDDYDDDEEVMPCDLETGPPPAAAPRRKMLGPVCSCCMQPRSHCRCESTTDELAAKAQQATHDDGNGDGEEEDAESWASLIQDDEGGLSPSIMRWARVIGQYVTRSAFVRSWVCMV